METYTKEQMESALSIAMSVSREIRQLGRVSAAAMFMFLEGRMDMEAFQALMSKLEDQGLITYGEDDVITWVGPTKVPAITNGHQKKG